MEIEQISFDNITTLYNFVMVLFPILAILEIGLYLLYLFKVKWMFTKSYEIEHLFSSILG